MEDWLKCQISPLVKYRQNQPKVIVYIANITELLSYTLHVKQVSVSIAT